MRLELRKVIISLSTFLRLLGLENYDSSSLISNSKISSSGVESKSVDDILIHNFLIGPFVAKELRKLVVSSLGRDRFFHSSIG